ncbi:alpha/beta fold hydrolase [Cupriavidus sp. 2TAF22]|uniref:alpha/beta fold hydrolase n=1 Tax=unclassified Cupriavidus TaxID=2640874 RepID=UPI003F901230
MLDDIFTLDRGAGEPVVLISGLGGLAAFWRPVVEILETSRRVISLDHPGVGKSRIQGAPTISGIADAVIRCLDERGIEQADIIGHSTGSLVAQAMALDFPPRVKSIVLSSGWAKPDKRFQDFFAFRKHVLRELGGDAYNTLTKLTAYPSEWYGKHLATEARLDFPMTADVDIDMVIARIDMLLDYTRYKELVALRAPTLVVGAQDDYIIPFHHSQELARLIPGACLQELAGGHFAPVTRTVAYVAMLNKFWESAA